MLQPAVRTVALGFQANGWQVFTGWGVQRATGQTYTGTDATANDTATANIAADANPSIWRPIVPPLGRGDVFVWVGVLDAARMAAQMRAMRTRGVFTIYYSSDAGVTSCVLKAKLGDAVSEVWEYSRANLLLCNTSQPVRYVPPGHLPGMQLANITGSAPVLVFAGHIRSNPERRAVFANVSTELKRLVGLNAQIINRENLWADVSWNRMFASAGYFANLHKVGDDYRNLHKMNCEAFRFATLLSAGAHVISLRCRAEDEAEYEGLVDFVNYPSDVAAAFGAAYTHRRDEEALARRDAFAARFAPEVLFRRAGVPALLEGVAASPSGSTGSVESGALRI